MSVSRSISDGEMRTDERSPGTADVEGSAWSPFRHAVYTVLWVATVLSNTGSWMQNAAAGWLMTSLRPDPFEVALVQAATTLPMFVFSLPAGALADIIDRRRLLIMVQIAAVAIAALFAIFVWLNWVTPNWLLTFMSLSGIATVLAMPPWQSIVPQLVPKVELRSASRSQRCGLEYQPRHRSRVGRLGDWRTRHGGTLLDQRVEHVRRHRGADLVAPSAADRAIPTRGAFRQRYSQRLALRSL
jgi:hypothetical protein